MTNRTIIERISPLWLGIGVCGSLVLILLAIETALGQWDAILVGGEFDAFAKVTSGPLRDFRIAFVHCLLIGYLPAAFLNVLKRSRQTVFALQGALNCTREECEKLADSLKLSTTWLVIIGVLGLAVSFVSPYLVPPVPAQPWNPASWSPEVAWHRIGGPFAGLWSWWLGVAVVTVSVRMSKIARRLSRIDLLNLSPLQPFTQLGLTCSLMLMGSLSLWSLMLLETGFGQMLAIAGTVMLASAVIALWLPVRGVHERIQQSKQLELEWVNREISNQRASLQSPGASSAGGGMADFVTYRNLIEGVPEWPFTTSTFTRLIFYALIPVLSWGAGIIAEEIVNRVLSGK